MSETLQVILTVFLIINLVCGFTMASDWDDIEKGFYLYKLLPAYSFAAIFRFIFRAVTTKIELKNPFKNKTNNHSVATIDIIRQHLNYHSGENYEIATNIYDALRGKNLLK